MYDVCITESITPGLSRSEWNIVTILNSSHVIDEPHGNELIITTHRYKELHV